MSDDFDAAWDEVDAAWDDDEKAKKKAALDGKMRDARVADNVEEATETARRELEPTFKEQATGFAQGAADTLSMGLAPKVAGVASMIPAISIGKNPLEAYMRTRDALKAKSQAAQEAVPGSYAIGQGAGDLVGIASGGLARGAAGAAGMAGRTVAKEGVKAGALAGGASGAASGDGWGDSAWQALKGTAIGGLLGAAPGVGRMADEGLMRLKSKITGLPPQVQDELIGMLPVIGKPLGNARKVSRALDEPKADPPTHATPGSDIPWSPAQSSTAGPSASMPPAAKSAPVASDDFAGDASIRQLLEGKVGGKPNFNMSLEKGGTSSPGARERFDADYLEASSKVNAEQSAERAANRGAVDPDDPLADVAVSELAHDGHTVSGKRRRPSADIGRDEVSAPSKDALSESPPAQAEQPTKAPTAAEVVPIREKLKAKLWSPWDDSFDEAGLRFDPFDPAQRNPAAKLAWKKASESKGSRAGKMSLQQSTPTPATPKLNYGTPLPAEMAKTMIKALNVGKLPRDAVEKMFMQMARDESPEYAAAVRAAFESNDI